MSKTVRVIGDGVPYLDGAEAELLEFMKNADDRSIGSDELAAGIHDWPSMYHLSRARANLLMPFNISENHRVLDVGCGTGALTRQFAEWGSDVTGLEGSYDRALVASERVREFENAEIVNGSLEEYASEGHKEEFDVILLCGVLEYSGAIFGGSDGPDKMLASVNQMLKPDGILIIAIENQLGMKYLLGYNEDHLATPWIGLSDYMLDTGGIRTWTRSRLGELLSKGGFSDTKWFGSFPDYKLPTAIVSDELWDLKDGKQLARQFVRKPIVDKSAGPQYPTDVLSFWDLILQTDSPRDFVNSHLVVASKKKLEQSTFLRDGLIWTGHGDRIKKFSHQATLTKSANGLEFTHDNSLAEKICEGAIQFKREKSPVIVGMNMEDWLVSRLRNTTQEQVCEILKLWWLEAEKVLNSDPQNEFNFDILPRNFVWNTESESWTFIDNEFRWLRPVSRGTILLRSLLLLFLERLNGLRIPVSTQEVSFGEFLSQVANETSGTTFDSTIEDLIEFESQVSAAIQGHSIDDCASSLRELLSRNVQEFRWDARDLSIKSRSDHLSQELSHVTQELSHVTQTKDSLQREVSQIVNSRSWILTSPLRKIGNLIKR